MARRVPKRAGLLGAGLTLLLSWSGLATLHADRVDLEALGRLAAAQRPSYPTDHCLVTGRRLVRGSAVELVVDGHLLRLADDAAASEVLAEPGPWIRRLHAAVREREAAAYPLELCPIDGRPLAAAPYEVVLGTRLVRVCDRECGLAARAAPGPVLETLDRAYWSAQTANYPLTTCIVTGRALGDAPVEHLHGTTLVRVADQDALERFLAAPHRYLAELGRLREVE